MPLRRDRGHGTRAAMRVMQLCLLVEGPRPSQVANGGLSIKHASLPRPLKRRPRTTVCGSAS